MSEETQLSKPGHGLSEIQQMGEIIARSGLFGIKNPDQAMALMLISQAEGRHPAIASLDYHVIQNRPTLKADAILARFQAAGGKVEYHHYDSDGCDATFSHPQGGSVRVKWDHHRAQQAELAGSANYRKFPAAMYRARCISEGVRTVYPGVTTGFYTPEEVVDFETHDKPAPRNVTSSVRQEPKPASATQSTSTPKEATNTESEPMASEKQVATLHELIKQLGLSETAFFKRMGATPKNLTAEAAFEAEQRMRKALIKQQPDPAGA